MINAQPKRKTRNPGESRAMRRSRESTGGENIRMASGRPGLRLLEGLERGLSRVAPAAGVTPILKRWIVGGYIYQGYRQGLKELE